MQSIGIIEKTDFFTISVDSFKCRTYWTLQQFWHNGNSEITRLETLLQEYSSCFPSGGTVVLHTTNLRIMQPHVADQFLQLFHTFLAKQDIQALAHVGDPHNITLKMQFQRVLRELGGSTSDLLHRSFSNKEEAEDWLDIVAMPRSRKIASEGFLELRTMSISN